MEQVFLLGEEPPKDQFFEKLKGWMRPKDVANLLGISIKTIYDWNHRPHRRKTPEGLFIKFNGQLLIRTEVLRSWIYKQND